MCNKIYLALICALLPGWLVASDKSTTIAFPSGKPDLASLKHKLTGALSTKHIKKQFVDDTVTEAIENLDEDGIATLLQKEVHPECCTCCCVHDNHPLTLLRTYNGYCCCLLDPNAQDAYRQLADHGLYEKGHCTCGTPQACCILGIEPPACCTFSCPCIPNAIAHECAAHGCQSVTTPTCCNLL